MRKGTRFFIALAAAGLTFGTLTATLGPKQFNHFHGHHCGWHHSWHHSNTCTPEASTPSETTR